MSSPLGWAQLGSGVLSGIGDFISGNQNSKYQQQLEAAYQAMAARQEAAREREFGVTSAENSREFDANHTLNTSKFNAGQEQQAYNRGLTNTYAKVRSPLIMGLMQGQQLKNNPGMSRYSALLGGGTPTGTPPGTPPAQP